MSELIFLKLGGSLITEKDKAHTALLPQIDELAVQIKRYLKANPTGRLVVGHGSGSFGHQPAKKFDTRNGVRTEQEWRGFAEVWNEARALNQIVLERLHSQGLPVISFPFSSSGICDHQRVLIWKTSQIKDALLHGLLPVVYGDVAFDESLGGTIVSTEEQFEYLVQELHPKRVLLAGIEPGVWKDFPKCTTLLPELNREDYAALKKKISGSVSIDVTGGMASKVEIAFSMIQKEPGLKVQIFSAKEQGALLKALNGEKLGTLLMA
jgi:isopentenyl phosphate kinase